MSEGPWWGGEGGIIPGFPKVNGCVPGIEMDGLQLESRW